MSKFELSTSEETPYLYVTRKCSMEPADVSKNMGIAFSEVMNSMQSNNICPSGPAISVYYNYSLTELEFRAGFVVEDEDLAKATDSVKPGKSPITSVLTYTHLGPYSKLRENYSDMMAHLDTINRTVSSPSWEVYVNDPESTPESELRTDIYMAIS